MRPLELRLRNFRSYFGEDAVFDFRERGLVGVVGPIGAGKSSLLDAIAFALFGRTPTVAASTKQLIHQRADGATVSLRFSVDDELWEVTRALRRKGQSVHGLTRLDRDVPGAEKLETIVLEGEVNARIVDLIGLEFDGFSRSIMLAQGRFAEFLQSRPAERDKVLKGVFGHDRIDAMRAAAKDRSAAEAARVEALGARLEAADALAARIAAAAARLAADEARLELLRKAEARFSDFAERREATTRVISHAESRLAELAPLAETLPAAAIVGEVVGIAHNANETRQRLAAALEAAQAQLVDRDAAVVELDPAATRERIDQAMRYEVTLEQLASQGQTLTGKWNSLEKERVTLVERLATATGGLDAAVATLEEAAGELAEATRRQQHATATLHTAQHRNMAATLRSELVIGEPCPVCDQTFDTVPTTSDAAELDQSEAALEVATEQLEAARRRVTIDSDAVTKHREAVTAGQAQLAAVEADLESNVTARAQIDIEAEENRRQLTALIGDSTVDELRTGLEKAEAAAAQARKTVDAARREHDEAIRAAQAAEKELGSLRLALAELATRLDVPLGSIDGAEAVAAAFDQVRAAWADTVETLTTARVAADHERAEIAAADRELRRELDIDGEFAAVLAEVAAAAEVRRQQIEEDKAALASSAELRAGREEAARLQSIYESLTAELTDSKFVRYLLDEEKRDLAELGSEHFERLSSGRYRFSTDGEFHVVDLTSADAIRRADSLSGGETFLASLALALALAEMVARTGGRLDAFFLDEGFGSLDPEHLDLAMEGIEQLAAGASDRLVLVVSHVPDMRHRLEDLIELDRNPVTGDTVVIRG